MSGKITEGFIDPKVVEVERHHHNREKWFGLAAVASGELHVADRMDGVILPFQLTSGASDFGSWVQVLGSDDTPVDADMTKFDGHRVLVTATDDTNPFIIQIVSGESADIAAKILAEEFTEFPFVAATNNIETGISDLITRRVDAGEKVWARCACVGVTGKLIDFYFGIHEYPV